MTQWNFRPIEDEAAFLMQLSVASGHVDSPTARAKYWPCYIESRDLIIEALLMMRRFGWAPEARLHLRGDGNALAS